MKKLSLFVLLIAAMFTSCGSDDDSPVGAEITEANLIGNWKLTSETENGTEITLDACDLLYTIQLFVNDQGENRAKFIEGVETTGGACEPSTSVDYVWSLTSGNMLNTETVEGSVDQDSEKIIELTTSTLKLEYTENEGNEEFIIVETYTKQ